MRMDGLAPFENLFYDNIIGLQSRRRHRRRRCWRQRQYVLPNGTTTTLTVRRVYLAPKAVGDRGRESERASTRDVLFAFSVHKIDRI